MWLVRSFVRSDEARKLFEVIRRMIWGRKVVREIALDENCWEAGAFVALGILHLCQPR